MKKSQKKKSKIIEKIKFYIVMYYTMFTLFFPCWLLLYYFMTKIIEKILYY